MKLGHEFYPLKSLRSNQKYGVFLKKPQNSGKFAQIFIPYSNGHLSPHSRRVHVHKFYCDHPHSSNIACTTGRLCVLSPCTFRWKFWILILVKRYIGEMFGENLILILPTNVRHTTEPTECPKFPVLPTPFRVALPKAVEVVSRIGSKLSTFPAAEGTYSSSWQQPACLSRLNLCQVLPPNRTHTQRRMAETKLGGSVAHPQEVYVGAPSGLIPFQLQGISRGMRPPNRWRRWRGKFVWRWRGNFP